MKVIDGLAVLRDLTSKAISASRREELLVLKSQLKPLEELAKRKLMTSDAVKREQITNFIRRVRNALEGIESKIKRTSEMIPENTLKIGNFILESISDFFLSEIDRPMANLQANRQIAMRGIRASKMNAAVAPYRLGRAPISLKKNDSLIRSNQRQQQRERVNREMQQQNTALKTQMDRNIQNKRNAQANIDSKSEVVNPAY